MNQLKIVGKPTPRIESIDLVTGEGKFVDDMELEGMLHAKILRSPYAHAKILSIITEKATSRSDVKAVITALDKDLPRIPFPSFAPHVHIPDQRILNDTVRYVGEPVAIVAAESVDLAQQALDLIDVNYEVLPAVFSAEEAMKPGAPQLHEEVKNNIAKTVKIEVGNIDEGFKRAEHMFEETFSTSPYLACEPEPYTVLANLDKDEKCTVWSTSQAPFFLQTQIAGALSIKPTVIAPPWVGGGFGRKTVMHDDPLVILLAQKTHRPVKLTYTRDEHLGALDTNLPLTIKLKTGVKGNRFIARYADVTARAGGYLGQAHAMLLYGLCHWASLYRCPNVKLEGKTVYTNNRVTSALRGFGVPMFMFALESHVDSISSQLGADPIDFRLKNIVREGDTTPTGFKITTCGLERCIKKAAELTGWRKKRRLRKTGQECRYGIGLAVAMQPCGSKLFEDVDISYAEAKVDDDGIVAISTGCADTGVGSRTGLAMIAAEELGVDLRDIRIVSGDTSKIPFDAGCYASRTTVVGGQAVRLASADLKRKLLKAASRLMKTRSSKLEIKNGRVYLKGSKRSKQLAEIISEYQQTKKSASSDFIGRGSYDPASRKLRTTKIRGRETLWGDWAAAHSFVAQVVEVEVDIKTGQTNLLKMTTVADSGRIINPLMATGSLEGAIEMGCGFALTEEPVIDEKGQTVNPTFLDYKYITSLDYPVTETVFLETLSPRGAYGAKGAGEVGLPAVVPAIANAIFNATGARIREMPITSEKIWKAINLAKA